MPKIGNAMKSKLLYLCLFLAMLPIQISGQVASGYEVADWSGFRTCAVTYTFDDNSTKQFTVVQPIFDKYGYKMTFFVITKKITSWTNYINATNKGHEIASHTVNHIRMDTMALVRQDSELKNSKELIISKSGSKCLTMSYPNCALADRATTQKYYIAARSCAGTIVPKTPSDFYRISSISTGNASTAYMQTVKQFNEKVNSAKSSKGWCVFLTHSIDDEAGYSPTKSDTIAKHLEYINANDNQFWVASFVQVVKYIRERNAVSVFETMLNADLYKIDVADTLDNTVYDVLVTIRRKLPDNWENASLSQNGIEINTKISTINNVKYIVFDVLPDNGELILQKVEPNSVPDIEEKPFTLAPNPFRDCTSISSSLNYNFSVFDLRGVEIEKKTNLTGSSQLGNALPAGAYILRIVANNRIYETKLLKL